MLEHLKAHLLLGKAVILGVGNTLRSDDGVGSILASRLKDQVPFCVFDAGESPENYLEKIIKEAPQTVVIIDAVDFGGSPGAFNEIDGRRLKTPNLFSTHNASLSLAINYLQSNLRVDIIILIIQPKSTAFGENLSPEIISTLEKLENWFLRLAKDIKS